MQNINMITDADTRRLQALAGRLKSSGRSRMDHIAALKQRISTAQIVSQKDIPRNVVTINSRVRLRDIDSDRLTVLTLANPFDIRMFGDRLSVAGPCGTALLGKRVGQIVTWAVGAKVRRLRIERILYQPEAAGDFDL